MNAVDLVQDKLPVQLGCEISYGAQGRVFDILNQPDRVIKVSTLYDVDPVLDIDIVFQNISRIYNFIIDRAPHHLVKIYNFNYATSGARYTEQGPQKFIIYYSIQEKLYSLSEDEKKIFKTICQAHNNELELSRSLDDIFQELKCWYVFDYDKVKQFVSNYPHLPINNRDFHRRNILKDIHNNYKIIDFDLAIFK